MPLRTAFQPMSGKCAEEHEWSTLIPEYCDRYNRNMSASTSLSQAKQTSTVPGASGRRDHSVHEREGRGGVADELVVTVAALTRWRDASGGVTVIAIDGHGASWKSTIAEGLCSRTGASLVHTDDFFVPCGQRAVGSNRPEPWRAPATPAGETGRSLASYYEVIRLRLEALEPLRAGQEAVFHAFDWDSGAVSSKVTRVEPSSLVLLEGVYSAAPELGDLVDKAIYVDTPEPERLRRLRRDVAPEDWDGEWLRAEKEYFTGTRPLESFDLVIRGAGGARPAPQSARAPNGGRSAGSSDDEEHRR